MQGTREDFVTTLVASANRSIAEGYYSVKGRSAAPRLSLVGAIRSSTRTPIICEVKFVSPAEGRLREEADPAAIALAYEKAGAVAISVLTEPRHFGGRLEHLESVKGSVSVPVLMKDVVIDKVQVEAADKLGADAILLIEGVYRKRLAKAGIDEMIRHAHSRELEVLLEVHTAEEYESALRSEADLVGINNRSLETLEVSLSTSAEILRGHDRGKPIISESGLKGREDVAYIHSLGADAFLVGSTLMKASDPARVIRSLSGD